MTKVIGAVDTKRGRFYPWSGDKFVSVTTAIKDGIPKPGLQRWFIKNVAMIAAKNRKKLAEMTQAKAKDYILDMHYGDRDQDAANLGSTVHAYCEKIALMDNHDELVMDEDDPALPYVLGFIQFIKDHKPVFLETEATVYSRTHGYAGTADAFIKIGRKTYVVDYKSGKSVWPEAALQLSAYRYADFIGRADGSEDSIPTCSGGLIIHLRPEGYEIVPVACGPDVFDTFLSALDIFRWNAIDGENTLGEVWSKDLS